MIENKHPWTPTEIKAARTAHEWTQEEFARLVGTTQQRISEWERGLTPKNAWQRLLTIFFKDMKYEAKKHE